MLEKDQPLLYKASCNYLQNIRINKRLWDDSHRYQRLSTLESRRFHGNTKQKYQDIGNLHHKVKPGEKIFWIPLSLKFGYSTNANFLIPYLRKMIIKQLTFGRMISKWSVIRFSPASQMNTVWDRDLWSELLGLYFGREKEPYVTLETRVFTKWSR